MDILPFENINFEDISKQLREGKTFLYPTETCYGIGCDASNADAVEKIFDIKGRPKEKPCILLFKDREMLEKYAYIPKNCEKILTTYWPGPLTILFEVLDNSNLSSLLIPKTKKISCRISSHPFIQNIFAHWDIPIVSTSANISAEPSIYTRDGIMKKFSNVELAPDVFVDAGDLPPNPPSTIIEIKDDHIQVHRQGSIVF